jgi:hypothetical protein
MRRKNLSSLGTSLCYPGRVQIRTRQGAGRQIAAGEPMRCVAQALVHAAELRGERSRILAGTIDGVTVAIPVIEPRKQPAADDA